jgi:type II restriction enzyme
MENNALLAIQMVYQGKLAFCKFLSANDTGETGGHQSGIYISKPAISILFDKPGIKGKNKNKTVKVKWQNDFETDAKFIYYGQGTRNEYRITRFGKGFPFLQADYTGALFIFVKNDEDNYQGFVLNTENEIDQFLDTFGLSPAETNRIIEIDPLIPEEREKLEFENFVKDLKEDFPSSERMSEEARFIQNKVYDHKEYICSKPDQKLLDWTEAEYRLFRAIENSRYGKLISSGFPSVEDFISVANQVLNRRKSRAGKSLEHHLSALFDENKIAYTAQATTEGNKRPDFIFPSESAYKSMSFPTDRITLLAAKTTCKDRWRQVINEADRLRGGNKYLCTLQQGISSSQLAEMAAEKVVLVVPEPYISTYPKENQKAIWPIAKFIKYIKELESNIL